MDSWWTYQQTASIITTTTTTTKVSEASLFSALRRRDLVRTLRRVCEVCAVCVTLLHNEREYTHIYRSTDEVLQRWSHYSLDRRTLSLYLLGKVNRVYFYYRVIHEVVKTVLITPIHPPLCTCYFSIKVLTFLLFSRLLFARTELIQIERTIFLGRSNHGFYSLTKK